MTVEQNITYVPVICGKKNKKENHFLAMDSRILLMDEPFGALDEITKRSLQEEVKALQKKTGVTILFITHDIREALRLGDRVLVMDQGAISQLGSPEEILQHPANSFVRELVSGESPETAKE